MDVEYTRTDDVYQTPFEKAQIGNASDADFFISFHRNSSPVPNQYSGVETLVYDQSGQKLDMAQNINGALGELGFQELGVQSRPGLVVLRKTKMPAVLIEAGFINNEQDNSIFDSQFQDIAQAIASGILGTLNEQPPENPENSGDIFYRVQTGSFRQRSNADNLLYELEDQGFPAFILHEDGLYKVQVGAFKNLENAVKWNVLCVMRDTVPGSTQPQLPTKQQGFPIRQNPEYLYILLLSHTALDLWSQSCTGQIHIQYINIPDICLMGQPCFLFLVNALH